MEEAERKQGGDGMKEAKRKKEAIAANNARILEKQMQELARLKEKNLKKKLEEGTLTEENKWWMDFYEKEDLGILEEDE